MFIKEREVSLSIRSSDIMVYGDESPLLLSPE